ncbi:MAG: carboxymethylenebutenolidase [Micavibrio sp.]|nr:carboxymethylenebutenolidase [Micavibrio sp.]|tara:strand:- start:1392 stop:2093 length:702 start_codon:yes stop_codon:yes gene_type:complete
MSEVEIQARDGGTFKAYIAMPAVTPAPAIIMIQEIFGINKEMRDKCDALADQGYIAICPDLFWRIEPGIELTDQIEEELKRAFELFGAFDQDKGMEDLKATLAFMRDHDACNGKIGCMGYCLGGKLAYEMAAETDINASVSYYGVGLGAMLDKADNFSHPVLIHIAGDDEFTPKDEQEKIIEAMKDNDYAITYRYTGMDHAFARGNGIHYNKEAADLANDRSYKFLEDNLKAA